MLPTELRFLKSDVKSFLERKEVAHVGVNIPLRYPQWFWRSVRVATVFVGKDPGGEWREPELLMVLDTGSENPAHDPLWRFPGGKRLNGERLETAARREHFEETGIPPPRGAHMLLGDESLHAEGTRSLLIASIVVGGIRPEPPERFSTNEVARVCWFKLGELPRAEDARDVTGSLGCSVDRYNIVQLRDTVAQHWDVLRHTPYALSLKGLLWL